MLFDCIRQTYGPERLARCQDKDGISRITSFASEDAGEVITRQLSDQSAAVFDEAETLPTLPAGNMATEKVLPPSVEERSPVRMLPVALGCNVNRGKPNAHAGAGPGSVTI